jgi:hypothetical protein
MTRLLPKLLVVPLEAFVFAMAMLVAFKLVNGQISTRGLLIDPRTGGVSSLRVQKLLAVIAVASSFAAAIGATVPPYHRLPSVSREMLLLLGGSNAVVLIHRGFMRILDLLQAAITSGKDSNT